MVFMIGSLSKVSIVSVKNSLKMTDPDIASEWHPTKNGDLTPEMVAPGSHKKVWWMKPYTDPRTGKHFEFEWQSRIVDRAHKKQGCPYLSGQKVYPGFNDFVTTNPELLDEWDYEKNLSLKPENFTAGSHKKVWWRCQLGHEWQVSIRDRVRHRTGCPICFKDMRVKNSLKMTYPDIAKEWHPTKNGNLTPEMVASGSNRIVWWIKTYTDPRTGKYFEFEWQSRIVKRARSNHGCPYLSGQKVYPGFNDLKSQKPQLALEWNYEKNGPLKPEAITIGSRKRVWWRCQLGHEWRVSIADRVRYRTGCPICSKEMRSSFPEQALFYYISKYFPDAVNGDMHIGVELDIFIPSKNVALEYDGYYWHKSRTTNDIKKNRICNENNLEMIRIREPGLVQLNSCVEYCIDDPDSDKSLTDTIISVLRHLGVANPEVDVQNDRAEIMSNYIRHKKKNSLLVRYPEIAKEWHPTKNVKLTPDLVDYGSHKVV